MKEQLLNKVKHIVATGEIAHYNVFECGLRQRVYIWGNGK